MSKKDYEKAAAIAQEYANVSSNGSVQHACVIGAFIELFRGDNYRFDENRFRRACLPGANVKARG